MGYAFNSTIKVKLKSCKRCGTPSRIFSRGFCQRCSTIEKVMADIENETEQEIKEEGLSELVAELDVLASRYVRLSNADKDGLCACYTCDSKKHWTLHQNGHYIPRGIMYLRFDLRNLRPQCVECNEYKSGNLPEYKRRLEVEHSGITEILEEESRLVHKWSRSELKDMIIEFKRKIKQLNK